MAQLLTPLHSSQGIHPSIPAPLVKSVQKLGSNCVDYGKLSSFSETRSSSHNFFSASTRLSLKGSRRIRCSVSNTAGGQHGNVIGADDGEKLEKYIQDAGDKLVVVAVSTTTCGPCIDEKMGCESSSKFQIFQKWKTCSFTFWSKRG
uniref:Uncharacterized protein n=1 Tax=Picea sitchensis TaxID=3332 RepID=A9P253_PICSI|nr:unknown [Picea sitchensis]